MILMLMSVSKINIVMKIFMIIMKLIMMMTMILISYILPPAVLWFVRSCNKAIYIANAKNNFADRGHENQNSDDDFYYDDDDDDDSVVVINTFHQICKPFFAWSKCKHLKGLSKLCVLLQSKKLFETLGPYRDNLAEPQDDFAEPATFHWRWCNAPYCLSLLESKGETTLFG